MEVGGDEIARLVLARFAGLPKKRKPQVRADGSREWVPLSGIVVESPRGLECVALGTGMKCLPSSKVPSANGAVLHDWHAEIVCLRALNRYLLDQCLSLVESRKEDCVRLRTKAELKSSPTHQPFSVEKDVKFHMYCSEAPCGDASMELIMAAQEDATPWELPSEEAVTGELLGRGHFSTLGIVRRKPSRPDAPSTLSKSCTDKLALTQALSFLSSATSLLIHPSGAYLSSMTLPSSQYSEIACRRAFSATGRLSSLAGSSWQVDHGYGFCPFEIKTTSLEFEFSRRCLGDGKLAASNLSAVCILPRTEENLIGGVMQGRKAGDLRGASTLSRRSISASVRLICQLLISGEGDTRLDAMPTEEYKSLQAIFGAEDYVSLKRLRLLDVRNDIKGSVLGTALRGWTKNVEDNFQFTAKEIPIS